MKNTSNGLGVLGEAVEVDHRRIAMRLDGAGMIDEHAGDAGLRQRHHLAGRLLAPDEGPLKGEVDEAHRRLALDQRAQQRLDAGEHRGGERHEHQAGARAVERDRDVVVERRRAGRARSP